jgi:flavorubredoxin
VAVLYTSDYGFSDRLSQTLAKGITKAGVKTEMVDVLSVDPQVCACVRVCVRVCVCVLPPVLPSPHTPARLRQG